MCNKIWLVMLLLTASVMLGQNCDRLVDDSGNVFKDKMGDVEAGAKTLLDKGVDIRVRTFVYPMDNMDRVIDDMRKVCPSWQDTHGGMKSTLLVLAVAPNAHKMGVYYGSAWHKALDEHWNRIKQETMAPRFKGGDFAGGMIAAEEQFAKRIEASQEEAIRPIIQAAAPATVVTQQPTDYSGLWRVMEWGVILFFLCVVFWAFWKAIQYRNKQQNEIDEAQGEAINQRSMALLGLSHMRGILANKMDNPGYAKAQKIYDGVEENYSEMASEIKNDPTTDGLSASNYRLIGAAYKMLRTQMDEGLSALTQTPEVEEVEQELKAATPKETPKQEDIDPDSCETCGGPKDSIEHNPVPPRLGYHPHQPRRHGGNGEVKIPEVKAEEESRGGNTIFAPIVVGNEFGSREREEEHESRRVDRDDDSRSSGSSSWDSGSGSDYSSGGSSDFGSSSDFGGGGSSDFGGGGDSGGGGSSDF